ncbi:AAA family ATPase [uncultured Aggregatibacter sp.]|uniref:AAA family ATPase n=1 Tax=uncultured Aggregatibacter sp. TaxID=470564 RepID=UPI00259A9993|nr:AAA family ATPase [uncultured Aggregatibacter sp.]
MNEFYIFAVVVTSEGSVGKRKLKAFTPYFLCDGWHFEGSKIIRSKKKMLYKSPYNEYLQSKNGLSLSISAIVGENGSGKSSLVEFIIRLINNFATSIFGEQNMTLAFEHLHYIDGVEGKLYFSIGGIPYMVSVENRSVTLESFSSLPKNEDELEFVAYTTPDIFDNEQPKVPVEDTTPISEWKDRKGDDMSIKEKLSKFFFYTLVNNYSIYAYNSLDYKEENTSLDYESKIRKKKYATDDERSWLNGIFHKNDGYQVPLVLSPYRDKGNININLENELSKERLMALMIMPKQNFRIINNHLKVRGISVSRKRYAYDAQRVRNKGYYKNLTQAGFDKIENILLKIWGDVIAEDLSLYKNRRYYHEAIDYLTYKTLKISVLYSQYKRYFYANHHNIRSRVDEKQLKALVIRLSLDKSHITRKIRHILAYICYGMYENQLEYDISLLSDKAKEIIDKEVAKGNPFGKQFIYGIDDLVPPPIFDVKIQLVDQQNGNDVAFETLSSGEKQQAFVVSSILYHLGNIESVFRDNNKNRIAYSNVCIILEEIELYFHPQFQKNLIKYILDGIKQMSFVHIEGIQLMMVTHSPFVLSDIPTSNILALENGMQSDTKLQTFGANIYDMLNTSFFLHNSTIGDFAQWLIGRIILILKIYENPQYGINMLDDENEKNGVDKEFMDKYLVAQENSKNWNMEIIKHDYPQDYIGYLIDMIDEPLAKMALLQKYYEIFGEKELALKAQINEHRRAIAALEAKLKDNQ